MSNSAGGTPSPTVALVGRGRWGRHILRDLLSLGCEVHVAAPSAATRDAAMGEGAASSAPDLAGLPRVDGIVIATPARTHAAVVDAALGRGVPVFVEKPLCIDPDDAGRLAAQGEGLLFVMDKWRYHPGVRELAAIARSGELGRVTAIHARRVTAVHRHRDDVDTVWVHAPHDLAIVQEILGDIPPPRFAVAEHLGGERVSLIGVLGPPDVTIEISCVAPAHRREVRVVFEHGVAHLDGADADAITIRRSVLEGEPVEHRAIVGELPLLAELRAFVGHLAGGPAPAGTAVDGALIVLRVAELGELARGGGPT